MAAITAGEDCYIQLTDCGTELFGSPGQALSGAGSDTPRLGFEPVTLHGHPSAVKAVCVSQAPGCWPVLLSAGAQEFVIGWRLSADPASAEGMRPHVRTRLLGKYWRKDRAQRPLAERAALEQPRWIREGEGPGAGGQRVDQRYLAVTAWPDAPADRQRHTVVVAGTRQTAAVLTLSIDEEGGTITPAGYELAGQGAGLVLCLSHLALPTMPGCEPAYHVFAGTTSGCVD